MPKMSPSRLEIGMAGDNLHRRVRLIIEEGGQVRIGLQRHGDPTEVVLSVSDIAAIAETLDCLQQHTNATSALCAVPTHDY